MSETKLTWYSMNRDLKVIEHDPVGLEEAIQIVDRYMEHAGEHFEWFEDCVAATVFGFSRTKEEFIEISIDGPDLISFKYEAPVHGLKWYQRLWKSSVKQEEKELHSRDELVQHVEEFFRMTSLIE